MTRWYWEQRGGTLIQEFRAVPRAAAVGRQLIDGLIILGEENRCLLPGIQAIDIAGKDIVAIQTKNGRLSKTQSRRLGGT